MNKLKIFKRACVLCLGLIILICGSFYVTNAASSELLLFVSDRSGGYTTDHTYDEIYVMNSDGSNVAQLTNNYFYDGEPSWSPDGDNIVFESWRDYNHEIYTMNSDGTGQTNITNNSASDGEPSWSPDGSKIAFSTNRNGSYEIYTMNTDGTQLTRLTLNGGNYQPAWSPDGSKIVYESQGEIYVMNSADGSGNTALTSNAYQDSFPVWSPDGTKIAFASYRNNNWEIYLMNSSDGSGQTNVSNSNANDYFPYFSPSSNQLVYQSYRDGNFELYRMDSNGKFQTRMTMNEGSNENPVWLGAITHDSITGLDNLPTARRWLTASAVNGFVYAIGGLINNSVLSNKNEAYNIATNSWVDKAVLPQARHYASSVVARNNQDVQCIYVVGGYSGSYLKTVIEYNPVNDTWTNKSSMNYQRGNCAIAEYNGDIYVFGGYTGTTLTSTVEKYDVATDSWTMRANMPTVKWCMGAATVGDLIYVIGGSVSTNNTTTVATVWEYDPNENSFRTRTSMPSPGAPGSGICAYGIGVVNNKIYILGGFSGGSLNSILEYDPSMDSWSTKTTVLSVARSAFGCATYNNKIYAIGGQTTTIPINLNEVYLP